MQQQELDLLDQQEREMQKLETIQWVKKTKFSKEVLNMREYIQTLIKSRKQNNCTYKKYQFFCSRRIAKKTT